MTTADWLAEQALVHPARTALVCGPAALSFGELDERVNRVARRLASLGLGGEDRVALLSPNGIPFVVLAFALARLGAVLVPLHPRLTAPELRERLQDVRPRLVLAHPAFADLFQEAGWEPVAFLDPHHPDLLPGIPADAPLPSPRISLKAVQGILYTSGTSGRAKGVLLTYGNHYWNAMGWAQRLGPAEHDTWLAVMPLCHIGGLAILWRAALFGATVVIHEAFHAGAVCAELERGQLTLLSLVPTMLHRVLREWGHRPFPGVRAVLLGGGPIPQDLVAQCVEAGIPVAPTYGLTEAASQVATLHPSEVRRKLGSCGRPLPVVEVRVEGGEGEILVRGPTVMAGYWGHPEETASGLREGWLCTGDVGYLDEEGYLYVLDRREDRIVTGGENVSSAEVEAVLRAHPAVRDAGVVGIPDPEWGQRVVAAVELVPGAVTTEEELRAYCARLLAPYKVPKRIGFLPELPRTGPEKVSRAALREWAQEAFREELRNR
ncbi:MAG: o-succinylbenzoate--CoA ligase [Armatimonadota bacterium]|nr:o-succinylbenzoate--CoA ligase [Armatimonadota bacterium]MDR7568760.1 o-succinylbenzoate--CoA ligase [Armatimonadota bacterium]